MSEGANRVLHEFATTDPISLPCQQHTFIHSTSLPTVYGGVFTADAGRTVQGACAIWHHFRCLYTSTVKSSKYSQGWLPALSPAAGVQIPCSHQNDIRAAQAAEVVD